MASSRYHGLALIVTLVGIKMLIIDLYKIPILWTLATVAAVLGIAIAASLVAPKAHSPAEESKG